ncbi:uncharacterized protein Z519_05001 [Cladophialophora bantiana CBS 173.52]|uniref:Major facilitator superfamily (MFS) profile domain-containing protein n=1 Tax=Cladophialophora bantiana (strain ATCC 10958 / CBS 173.52 / CDC B-1940 / NIH 8579) TaxID=1442370 RepID=A0A0D2EYJ3_CLAB1|nr:uncharacterized protein Z519_05001 [Cladophialophora bantiana CBS 173.52]KIW95021.1 hypothetical protein Z519_05001 [Cladophialophora bantiana CBS 173.52]
MAEKVPSEKVEYASHDEVGDTTTAKHIAADTIRENSTARLVNPLAGIRKEDLMRQVERFATDKDLLDILPLLRKGAYVAQAAVPLAEVEELDPGEFDALEHEVKHRWTHPFALYATVFVCSIGAAVQGWDQTGSNGANLTFPVEFSIASGSSRDNWLIGLVNAAPYISSAILGCWLSDPVNALLGRRGATFLAAIFCIFTPIGGAVSQDWHQLLVTRLLMGFGMGLKAATIPMYAAENSPAVIRGALVMGWQMWTAFGIFLGFAANLVVYRVGRIAWRLQVGSAFIPAVPLALLVYFCPESPRWLMKKNRYKKAFESLCRLRKHRIQAARDLYYVHAQLVIEHEIAAGSTYITRLRELVTIPRIRRSAVAALVVFMGQQFCGMNIIAFYSSTVFVQAGASEHTALLTSLGYGIINFAFAIPAIFLIDRFGRRSLLLSTFPHMAWTLLAAGFCFYIPESSKAHVGMIAFFVYVFTALYSVGQGPVAFVYSAEAFPLSHREIGNSWAVSGTFALSSALSLTFPLMLSKFTATGAFGFYAAMNLFVFILMFLFVPDTSGYTLEELDYVFAVPTRRFISYQLRKVLPWALRRYLLFRRGERLEALYHFERSDQQGSESHVEEGQTRVQK